LTLSCTGCAITHGLCGIAQKVHYGTERKRGKTLVFVKANETGANIKSARISAGLTQETLARNTGITRWQITRFEGGLAVPRLDEAVRLAGALKAPLEWLIAGRWIPRKDLKGIALELFRMGIRDLEVADYSVPGALRHGEEVLVLALTGDRPEPRIVEAIPYVLARRKFRPGLAVEFADLHDKRACVRLAWLSAVTFALSERGSFPVEIQSKERLASFMALADKKPKADSLGHPSTGRLPPIWRRWNITYAGSMDDFLRRSIECHAAFEATRTMVGDEL
jgi:transcriptional regulator with XRE-family HTH domain